MKTCQILLLDKITIKVEKIENFKESESKNLKDRLLELQKGYCEDETPIVFVKTFTSNNLKISTAISESNSDYCYISALKVIK